MNYDLIKKLENAITQRNLRNEEVIYNNTFNLYNKIWDKIIKKIELGDELIVFSIKLKNCIFNDKICYFIDDKANTMYYDLNILSNLLKSDNLRININEEELVISTSFKELKNILITEKNKHTKLKLPK